MGRLSETAVKEISSICPGGVHRNLNLSEISQWKIGGPADLIIRPSSIEELIRLRRWFAAQEISPLVIGLTSNLLFADEGVYAPILQIGNRMSRVSAAGSEVEVQAGAWVPGLARTLMQAGLTGGEHFCGIPGTLGGLICMNGGSLRKGIGTNIIEVKSVCSKGELIVRKAEECHFSYRQSVFQKNQEIITSARLKFEKSDKNMIRRRMLAILRDRRRKFPRKQPNCGSIFKSNPAMYSEIGPPGAAIERLEFKGKRIGGAIVSPSHANFIVNCGDAKASDVLTLINDIFEAVHENTGHKMEVEVCYVNQDGCISSALVHSGR